MLHVLNGDSTRWSLEQSGVDGDVAVFADVLHEGPVPFDADMQAWLRTRSEYLSAYDHTSGEDVLTQYRATQQQLEACNDHDEVVLWFEHDLYDQLLLIRHLHWWRSAPRTPTLSLICIGEFPGKPDFHGLGELSPSELAGLLPHRAPVTDAQFDLGARAWRAFTSPDPTGWQHLLESDTSVLPFLEGAVRRMLEEYPSRATGLGRTEIQMLTLLADGPLTPVELFLRNQKHEERVFMGDATFWVRALDLARGPEPLIEMAVRTDSDGRGAAVFQTEAGAVARVGLTASGAAVLEGRADAVALNGIDRWFGGVHLRGRQASWRWDAESGALRAA